MGILDVRAALPLEIECFLPVKNGAFLGEIFTMSYLIAAMATDRAIARFVSSIKVFPA